MAIARITRARITKYGDTGDVVAYVDWIDARGKSGTTMGEPWSPHMESLLARARREGVRVKHDKAGAVFGPSGSWTVPPKRKPRIKTGAYCSKCRGPHRPKHGKR